MPHRMLYLDRVRCKLENGSGRVFMLMQADVGKPCSARMSSSLATKKADLESRPRQYTVPSRFCKRVSALPLAHSMADALITPLNDSFVDFDCWAWSIRPPSS
jgi:ATPase MipZ